MERIEKISNEKEINVDEAWNNVNSRINENGHLVSNEKVIIPVFRRTFIKVAAVVLLLISFGTAAFFLVSQGSFSKKISVATNNDDKNLMVDLPDGSKIYSEPKF